MSIERLLQATMKAGGQELRLIPGRRMVIVTPAGEREVQGPEQTPVMIDQLLAPLVLHLDPGLRWTGPINGCDPLRHDPLKTKRADGLKHFVAVAFGMFNILNPTARANEQPAERRLALNQRPPPQVTRRG